MLYALCSLVIFSFLKDILFRWYFEQVICRLHDSKIRPVWTHVHGDTSLDPCTPVWPSSLPSQWSLLPTSSLVRPSTFTYCFQYPFPSKYTKRGKVHTLSSASRFPWAPSLGGGASQCVFLTLLWAAWAQTPYRSSPVDRRLGHCQPFAITDSASVNNLVQMLFGTCAGVLKSGFAVWKGIIWVNTTLFLSTVFLPFCPFTSNFECIRISKLVPTSS